MEPSATELWISPTLSIPLNELEFDYVRSSGPGGQNVNKVNSQAQLHWNLTTNASIPPEVRERLQALNRRRVTVEGVFYLSSQRFRDQGKNRQDCLEKLAALVLAAATVPRKRKATKVPRGAKESRLREKRQRSEAKSRRKFPRHDD